RFLVHESKEEPSQAEAKLIAKLKTAFPEASCIQVADVSGGCGSMYEIYVASSKFEGIKTVNQHKMINEVLKEDIKKMHGIRINT
ncbi:hypothetical protein HELRODRAFT_147328, partial [Helobdella robusta]|uniref:Bola-like protein n=1 Tax=Helobdella robusta TaxID=6412 RepID=T1EJZ4_HELRO